MVSLRPPLSAARPLDRSTGGAAVVFGAGVLGEVGIAWAVATGGPFAPGHASLPFLLGLWSTAWVVALLATFRLPRRQAVGLILAAGMALRLVALAGPPTTSDDLFRYAWDGRVQAAGIDPYAQPPAANQLAGLREGWLWPDAAGCAAIAKAPGCTRINRQDVRTIYPPVAQAWFAAVYRVAGIGARHTAWQVAGVLTELATLGLLVVALRRWGRDPRWVALYALCPAPVIEIVNNGHIDGLAIALIVAALIVAAPRRSRPPPWREIAAAALLAMAALVKLYPLVLILPLVACRPARRLRALLWAGATTTVLAGIAYAPHVARVGTKVLGYLPGYLKEEHYQGGGRYLIATVVGIPHAWGGLVSLLGIALVVGWIVLRRPPLAEGAAVMVAAILLAGSPAQPWYAVTLLALATVAARPALLGVVAAGYVAAFASVLDQPHAATIGGWAYAAALAAIVIGATWRHQRGRFADIESAALADRRSQTDDGGHNDHDRDHEDQVGGVVVGE